MFFAFFLCASAFNHRAFGQASCMAWGNLTGMRVEGHLFKFETSLCLIGEGLWQVSHTAKEQQRPRYSLNGKEQTVYTTLDDINFTQVVTDLNSGSASIDIKATAQVDTTIAGAFFSIALDGAEYSDAKIQLIDSTASKVEAIPAFPGGRRRFFGRNRQACAKGIKITGQDVFVELTINEATEIIVQPGNRFFGNKTQIYCAILLGPVKKDQTAHKIFELKVSGKIDKDPVELVFDSQKPGRVFDGIGGNFRLQNPQVDPKVIDYCLSNLNVTWGRVEMPWSNWHEEESVNPIEAARAGHINQSVHEAMLMAQTLAKKNIPVIVSAWRAPAWAILGDSGFRQRQPGDPYGNPLNPAKMPSIIKSITSYITYLKEAYGVEALLFSFNESDLGINVRQTGEEHADLIKRLGVYMASHGLATKMLLGDNSDATTYEFIRPAIEDPETHKFIGAISFHSWRGCDNWTLSLWADAAKELNLPLLVGEGSTDAAAHRYPDIFLQPEFSLNEIDMYIRICTICQVQSILQWQLTSDYSVLAGDGIYNTKGELRPTQRFWNLKQLGQIPGGSFHLPLSSGANVSCAAFGDIANGIYSLHLVNNGATRQVTIKGFPDTVKELQMLITDENRGMEEGKKVNVSKGVATFTLDAGSYTTLKNIK